ncbi:PAS domain S-box protein [Moraxellaceae bacterium AER2_44_116]|nr:PAS domain S-box protein [Moraxellaceae bacterium]TQC99152.1 PAS domain S-box protein [Moraxellaceae bacterium AER2_44_116]
MKFIHKTMVSLVGAIALIIIGLLILFSFFGQIEQEAETRQQNLAVLHEANELMSALKDAETSQRGYLLTGSESFLELYLDVYKSINGYLTTLRQHSANPTANKQLDLVAPLINAKLNHMAYAIDLRRRQDMVGVEASVGSGKGKRLMDDIRTEMKRFITIQESILRQDDAIFTNDMRRLFIIILTTSLFALLFSFLYLYLFYKHNQQRLNNLIHQETKHLLEIQEQTNKQLLRANITLQLSEEKLAVTLNSIGDAVIATDAQSRVMFLNPVAEQLTGWTQTEAIGRLVDEIFHIISKTSRQPVAIPVVEALIHGKIQGLANHTILIARNNSECDIADSCAPIRDRNDEVIGAVLVFRDVTKEYNAQQALRDSTALVQTILNTVVDGIITFNACGGEIETVNPAVETLFGYANAEIIGQNLSLLIPELDQDPCNMCLSHINHNDGVQAQGVGRNVIGQRKDGSTFPLELAASEMLLGGQRYFTGILRDVTVRKQIEQEQKVLNQRLRDQQFYTRSLIESNVDALMATDPTGIITDVNKQVEELTGCTRDELIGAPFKNYFTDPELAEKAIKRVLVEKKVTNYELTARAREGKETPVSYNATTFYDRDRKLQGVFVAARDISERQRLDRILHEKSIELQSAKLVAEKANLAKSDFLSSMSHELRTPLNAILGFTQLIDGGTPAPTPSQKRSVDQILKAGWYLLELINEILDLALIESGKLSLSIEPVSLAKVMHECWLMVEPQTQRRSISVILPTTDVLYFVQADRTRVKQILINLLTNAIKYNKDNGTVVVTCHVVTSGRIRIGVEDTGEGLSSSQITQLFLPFNRLGQEANAEEGTGIGLVVCKRLVELMGGSVGVESTVGVGSVFWFELNLTTNPKMILNDAEEIALVEKASQQIDEPRYSLLYIEDNPANLMLVEDIIARRPDIRLLSARDGKSGIKMAHAAQPDVILMDINLPGISGLKALRILAESSATTHIPIIALSANAMPRDIEKGMEAGFFRYLTKPIKVNEFMATLDVALTFATSKITVPTKRNKHDGR